MDEFFRIRYTGKVKRTERIFDTTDKEKAKKEDIYNEKFNYGPRVITDKEEMVEGVMKALEEMDEDEERTLELPPEKAYGERNPSKIEMVPKKDFEDTKVNPIPGLRVILDGEPAKIQTVSGGRVRVDFNNPLAGKDLEYDVELIEKIQEDEEKAVSLSEKLLDLEEDEVEAEEEENKVMVKVPENTIEEDEEEIRGKLKEEIEENTDYEEVEIEEKEIQEDEDEE